MKNPLVSVITVSYNSQSTIIDTFESVLNQTYSEIEYVVIDGESSDGTQMIIDNYRGRISKVLIESDSGVYEALNKGIKMSSGEIIIILNSDDYFSSESSVRGIIDAFEENKADCIYSNIEFFSHSNSSKIAQIKPKQYSLHRLRYGWSPPHPGFFVKKDVYKKCGLFNLDYKIAADYDLMMRLFLNKDLNIAYINNTFVKMRSGGLSTGSIRSIINGNVEILKSLEKGGIKINRLLYLFFRFFPKIKRFVLSR